MRWKRPLYIMIKPSPANLPGLIRLCTELSITISYPPSHWHCTFLALGESSPAAVEAIRKALRDFEAEAFSVEFNHVDGNTLRPRKNQREPGALHRRLARRIAACGHPLPAFDFGLHLNLIYDKVSDRRVRIPLIAWPVEQILLIESVNGRARHIEHDRWRLAHRQAAFAF